VNSASTPIETKKPLVKDEEAANMEVHLYTSMIGSLMYLTASRPDIIESAFDLEAYSDSDYARANLDRKSTTGGCQFLEGVSAAGEALSTATLAISTVSV
nr:hypothetical protein [Tanacetum cinerariifolium]